MSDKDKAETLRIKARRAAFAKLQHRPFLDIDIVIRERIVRGEKQL